MHNPFSISKNFFLFPFKFNQIHLASLSKNNRIFNIAGFGLYGLSDINLQKNPTSGVKSMLRSDCFSYYQAICYKHRLGKAKQWRLNRVLSSFNERKMLCVDIFLGQLVGFYSWFLSQQSFDLPSSCGQHSKYSDLSFPLKPSQPFKMQTTPNCGF